MDTPKKLNAAVMRIEATLCEHTPDIDGAARRAGMSRDGFERLFAYVTGMTLTTYIRKRRLSLAAFDIADTDTPIVDIAVKYGHDSTAAFTRAFKSQHGITPSEYRKYGGRLSVYPPASFEIRVKGACEMNMKIIETDGFEVYGISKEFDRSKYGTIEDLRHEMWTEDYDDIPGKLCEGRWNQPGNCAYDGEWYGLLCGGRYAITRKEADVKAGDFERFAVPPGRYAVFTSEKGGYAGDVLPRLYELVFGTWFPTSGYRRDGDDVIEIYHLCTDKEERRRKRYYELMVKLADK